MKPAVPHFTTTHNLLIPCCCFCCCCHTYNFHALSRSDPSHIIRHRETSWLAGWLTDWQTRIQLVEWRYFSLFASNHLGTVWFRSARIYACVVSEPNNCTISFSLYVHTRTLLDPIRFDLVSVLGFCVYALASPLTVCMCVCIVCMRAFHLACAKWKERHFRMILQPQPHIHKKCFRANASRFVEQRILFRRKKLHIEIYIYTHKYSHIPSKKKGKKEATTTNHSRKNQKEIFNQFSCSSQSLQKGFFDSCEVFGA